MMTLMILVASLVSCETTNVKDFCLVAPYIDFNPSDTDETKRRIIDYTMIKSEYCE